MEHTPKEEEKRLREEFINKIELDKMIKDIGYTGAKGTIADYWIKIRQQAIAEERDLHLRREKHIIDILCKDCKQEYVEYAERNDL